MTCTRQSLFAERLQEVLGVLAEQWPDCAVKVDLWRPSIVTNPTGFADDGVEKWVRLAENIDGFLLRKRTRWYQEGVGVLTNEDDFLLIPSEYGLKEQDHVVIKGTSYSMIEITEQAGIAKAKLDGDSSRFKKPTRTDPVYRQMTMRVLIA